MFHSKYTQLSIYDDHFQLDTTPYDYLNLTKSDRWDELKLITHMNRIDISPNNFIGLEKCLAFITSNNITTNELVFSITRGSRVNSGPYQESLFKEVIKYINFNGDRLQYLSISDIAIDEKQLEILVEECLPALLNVETLLLEGHYYDSMEMYPKTRSWYKNLHTLSKRTKIVKIDLPYTGWMKDGNMITKEIQSWFNIPIDERELPVYSKTKSAAKIT